MKAALVEIKLLCFIEAKELYRNDTSINVKSVWNMITPQELLVD